jgi:glutamate-1-semialdehyde aminotransferase
LELRATTSLARLLATQGKRDEARTMLADIYNWFISAAHTDRDIEQTLNVTEQAFAAVCKQFGA